jgi:ribosome-binding protein aMBF1 (putative translation factor)
MAKTSDFIDVIQNQLARDPELEDLVDSEAVHADIAQCIFDARTSAKLSQRKLAELVDTQQSVISRMEDASYEGHSISLLRRIARALGCRLSVGFVSEQKPAANRRQYSGRKSYPWTPPATVTADTETAQLTDGGKATLTIRPSVA